jgi:hypothetical protein
MLSNELLGFIRRQVCGCVFVRVRPSVAGAVHCSIAKPRRRSGAHGRACTHLALARAHHQSTGKDLNVSADSAGDDVYTWNVWLWKTAFAPDSQMAKVGAVWLCAT